MLFIELPGYHPGSHPFQIDAHKIVTLDRLDNNGTHIVLVSEGKSITRLTSLAPREVTALIQQQAQRQLNELNKVAL